VVEDGSRDRTADLVRAAAERDPRVRLVSYERNRGYGDALRSGFLAARLRLLHDADLPFELDELEGRACPAWCWRTRRRSEDRGTNYAVELGQQAVRAL